MTSSGRTISTTSLMQLQCRCCCADDIVPHQRSNQILGFCQLFWHRVHMSISAKTPQVRRVIHLSASFRLHLILILILSFDPGSSSVALTRYKIRAAVLQSSHLTAISQPWHSTCRHHPYPDSLAGSGVRNSFSPIKIIARCCRAARCITSWLYCAFFLCHRKMTS